MKKITAGILSVMLLSACAQPGQQGGMNKAAVGTLAGAAAGAAIGSNLGKGKGNVAAIAAGTLLGAALGNQIGQSLDKVDLMYHNQTAQHALETAKSGTTLAWRNPDSGHSGTITPVSVTQNATGQYCREYRQSIMVGGQAQEAYGTACRQPDGSWKIQN